MIIYSEQIIDFISQIKRAVKEILSSEVGLRVTRDRFYKGRFSYPIHLVIYHSSQVLGYFDAPFYEIGINECLMRAQPSDLKNILRHEIAHYLTFIEHGSAVLPHGNEFQECCLKFGWGSEISQARTCLEKGKDISKTAVFRKVQKLMALSTSANEHEAESALIKSQELLLKHNIKAVPTPDEEPIVLKRLLMQKKKTAKMSAIGKILETFFVSVVYHRHLDGTCLEILGEKVNVEIAEYVASVLENKLDTLWLDAKKTSSLKGSLAKNSFLLGVAKGYCDKIEDAKQSFSREMSKDLLVIEKKLTNARQMAYKRLSSYGSSAKLSKQASMLGQKMGKSLNIQPGIKKKFMSLFLTKL